METTQVIVTNVLPTGSSFGVKRQAMHEGVFIPAKVGKDIDGIKPGSIVNVVIVPNVTHNDKTQWQAVAADGSASDKDDFEDAVINALADGDLSLQEISEDIGATERSTKYAIDRLVKSGKLVSYTIYGINDKT